MIILVGRWTPKMLFLGGPVEAPSLHSHSSGLRETELQVILLGDRTLSYYHSFIGKTVLKRLFNSDTDWLEAEL